MKLVQSESTVSDGWHGSLKEGHAVELVYRSCGRQLQNLAEQISGVILRPWPCQLICLDAKLFQFVSQGHIGILLRSFDIKKTLI